MACVPLKVKGRVVGVLGLINKRKGLFSDADLAQLQGFAHPMATAIENARLYAQSERERAIIHATSDALGQPLMIVGHRGERIMANEAASTLLKAAHEADEKEEGADVSGQLDQLVISRSVAKMGLMEGRGSRSPESWTLTLRASARPFQTARPVRPSSARPAPPASVSVCQAESSWRPSTRARVRPRSR